MKRSTLKQCEGCQYDNKLVLFVSEKDNDRSILQCDVFCIKCLFNVRLSEQFSSRNLKKGR